MGRFMIAAAIAASAFLSMTQVAFADSTGTPGRPGQSCENYLPGTNRPGTAISAPGSAFNDVTPGVAGGVYAGNGQTQSTPAASGPNPPVSQYDVACFQQFMRSTTTTTQVP